MRHEKARLASNDNKEINVAVSFVGYHTGSLCVAVGWYRPTFIYGRVKLKHKIQNTKTGCAHRQKDRTCCDVRAGMGVHLSVVCGGPMEVKSHIASNLSLIVIKDQ
jgi:hypothetical protein